LLCGELVEMGSTMRVLEREADLWAESVTVTVTLKPPATDGVHDIVEEFAEEHPFGSPV